MARPAKELAAELNANKKGRTFKEMKALLESYGFRMHKRKRGSHRAFSKEGCDQSPTLIETKGDLLPIYVRKVVRALEECCDDETG